jgi:hypothetical protein
LEEYKKIVRDVQRNKIKSEDFIELLLALNIADITRKREGENATKTNQRIERYMGIT